MDVNQQTENAKQLRPSAPVDMGCCAERESGRSRLQLEIKRLEERRQELQTILNMLPSKMTHDQDQAVWSLFASKRI